MGTDRKATTNWTGGLATGSGITTLDSSGTGRFEVSWPARTEAPNGKTSPEELIAAAHSACYSMMLSHLAAEAGGTPRTIDTSAVVTFVVGSGVTKIALQVRAAIDGLDDAAFEKAVQDAKDQCPVSNLVKGNTEVTLDAARS
jgi:osmotically inducible protein OsmC